MGGAKRSKGAARGGGRSGAGRRSGGSGIEKYGHDEADEVLGFTGDDAASEAPSADSMDDLDEEVMGGGAWDDEEEQDEKETASFKKALKHGKKAKAEEKANEAAEDAVAAGTSGWKGEDFWGGDDAGDSSDGGSDEELNYLEAKRLEEKRAQRIGGLAHADPMAVLLGGVEAPAAEDKAEAPKPQKKAAKKAPAASFDSVFGADAETEQVQRGDLSELSEAKKRSLVKREAPELVPLLQDYQAKLEGLKEILPMLKPKVLAGLPKSGAAYVKAKAGLLLSTLANLSYYVLLRAEGGSVRSHPVISQLVWLKELHEKIAPLDKKLKLKLKKATKAAKKVESAEPEVKVEEEVVEEAAESDEEVKVEKKRVSLKEKLARLRAREPAAKPTEEAERGARALVANTKDLLRLPGKRKRDGRAGGPADLDEVDPTLGAWVPKSTLSEQLHTVRQYVGDNAAKNKVGSADGDVEARPRRERVRARETVDPMEAKEQQRPAGIASAGLQAEMEGCGEEDDLVATARRRAHAKKEQKSDKQLAKEKAAALRQYRPEDEKEGRRKTSRKILDNRGLVRQRKKTSGNARVSNRDKYEKMVKRRKGAVVDMREAHMDGATYEGEATGVRTHLKKSQKLV